MPIVPDTKDWTWVLERPCPECGFDASTLPADRVPELVRANAAAWQEVLSRPRAELTTRPSDDRWSALEYACHVRDVLRLYDQRLALMLTEDDPDFANWDQDEAAIKGRYAEQDPEVVADQLEAAAQTMVDHIQALRPDQLGRTGRRSNGSEFTVVTLLQYFLHDVVHHLWDVTGQQDAAASLALE